MGLLYPMPSWTHRDCMKLSECNRPGSAYSGICNEDGSCDCEGDSFYSRGVGPNATCHYIPVEDMTYIQPVLKYVGYALAGIQVLFSVVCIFWTNYYKEHHIVRKSQPIFLTLVYLGCCIMCLSIFSLSVEAGYPSSSTKLVDVACMTSPWLLVIGFAIAFSALFAKVWRIRKVLNNAASMRRVIVRPKDVAVIMIGLISLETGILIAWQILAPLK